MTDAGEDRRRWTTEQQVLLELERLGDLSLDGAQDYSRAAQTAAESEAAYKQWRAKAMLRAQASAKANGDRVSAAQAEIVADADDEVAAMHMARLTDAAVADAVRERLRSIRENQAALRTAAASHRSPFAGPGMQ